MNVNPLISKTSVGEIWNDICMHVEKGRYKNYIDGVNIYWIEICYDDTSLENIIIIWYIHWEYTELLNIVTHFFLYKLIMLNTLPAE